MDEKKWIEAFAKMEKALADSLRKRIEDGNFTVAELEKFLRNLAKKEAALSFILDGITQNKKLETLLYVVDIASNKLNVYNLDNPVSPFFFGEIDLRNQENAPTGTIVWKHLLYMADVLSNTIGIYDLKTPLQPRKIASFTSPA